MKNKNKIEMVMDKKDFIMFKTTCQCTDDNHTISVVVEAINKDDPKPLVSLFYGCGWREEQIYNNNTIINIFQRFWQRIKAALKILFTGELYLDEEFIFRDTQHLREFRNTLEEAILQVERRNEENKI